eukprot:TRINITY_DN3654_c1_g1_i2.p1 TRINITY_DN3654_c1_g1~~TRINITY_DN3654_c1_g1_i2.p1  ORF type:complete len:1018 (+),score=174.05 TRINITY_DN3654_c1_g1_i2:110-3055(+)
MTYISLFIRYLGSNLGDAYATEPTQNSNPSFVAKLFKMKSSPMLKLLDTDLVAPLSPRSSKQASSDHPPAGPPSPKQTTPDSPSPAPTSPPRNALLPSHPLTTTVISHTARSSFSDLARRSQSLSDVTVQNMSELTPFNIDDHPDSPISSSPSSSEAPSRKSLIVRNLKSEKRARPVTVIGRPYMEPEGSFLCKAMTRTISPQFIGQPSLAPDPLVTPTSPPPDAPFSTISSPPRDSTIATSPVSLTIPRTEAEAEILIKNLLDKLEHETRLRRELEDQLREEQEFSRELQGQLGFVGMTLSGSLRKKRNRLDAKKADDVASTSSVKHLRAEVLKLRSTLDDRNTIEAELRSQVERLRIELTKNQKFTNLVSNSTSQRRAMGELRAENDSYAIKANELMEQNSHLRQIQHKLQQQQQELQQLLNQALERLAESEIALGTASASSASLLYTTFSPSLQSFRQSVNQALSRELQEMMDKEMDIVAAVAPSIPQTPNALPPSIHLSHLNALFRQVGALSDGIENLSLLPPFVATDHATIARTQPFHGSTSTPRSRFLRLENLQQLILEVTLSRPTPVDARLEVECIPLNSLTQLLPYASEPDSPPTTQLHVPGVRIQRKDKEQGKVFVSIVTSQLHPSLNALAIVLNTKAQQPTHSSTRPSHSPADTTHIHCKLTTITSPRNVDQSHAMNDVGMINAPFGGHDQCILFAILWKASNLDGDDDAIDQTHLGAWRLQVVDVPIPSYSKLHKGPVDYSRFMLDAAIRQLQHAQDDWSSLSGAMKLLCKRLDYLPLTHTDLSRTVNGSATMRESRRKISVGAVFLPPLLKTSSDPVASTSSSTATRNHDDDIFDTEDYGYTSDVTPSTHAGRDDMRRLTRNDSDEQARRAPLNKRPEFSSRKFRNTTSLSLSYSTSQPTNMFSAGRSLSVSIGYYRALTADNTTTSTSSSSSSSNDNGVTASQSSTMRIPRSGEREKKLNRSSSLSSL